MDVQVIHMFQSFKALCSLPRRFDNETLLSAFRIFCKLHYPMLLNGENLNAVFRNAIYPWHCPLILCLIIWSFILKPLKHLLILYINYHIDTISKKNTSCMLLVTLKLHHYCFQWPKSCNQNLSLFFYFYFLINFNQLNKKGGKLVDIFRTDSC